MTTQIKVRYTGNTPPQTFDAGSFSYFEGGNLYHLFRDNVVVAAINASTVRSLEIAIVEPEEEDDESIEDRDRMSQAKVFERVSRELRGIRLNQTVARDLHDLVTESSVGTYTGHANSNPMWEPVRTALADGAAHPSADLRMACGITGAFGSDYDRFKAFIAKLAKDGVLIKSGPSNRPVYQLAVGA